MIITIAGDPGSGKSVVGKAIAEKFGLKRYSAGDFQRQIAIRRGVSLEELQEIAKTDPTVDQETDEYNKKIGDTEKNFIIDGRIAFHFIPHSIKIFLRTNTHKAAERIWRDIQNNKRETEKGFKSFDEVYASIVFRQNSECERYQKYYGVNQLDMKNYDIVIDATNLTVQQEIDAVVEAIKKRSIK
jgi:cytidylate kinase